MRVLLDAGGRQRFCSVTARRIYRLNGRSLKPIHDWVKNYERSWAQRFDRLDVVLAELKEQEEGDGGGDE